MVTSSVNAHRLWSLALVCSFLLSLSRWAVQYARDINDSGDFFPVWGTCLGWEWLAEVHIGTPRCLLRQGRSSHALELIFVAVVSTCKAPVLLATGGESTGRHALELCLFFVAHVECCVCFDPVWWACVLVIR